MPSQGMSTSSGLPTFAGVDCVECCACPPGCGVQDSDALPMLPGVSPHSGGDMLTAASAATAVVWGVAQTMPGV